ncbi:hypothetical protein CkaCkLH20_08814 [Colletotrichum karsti]|uniref:Extracellular membrane protein CFEM domain-containing protein n=1 Tax=Colletotrichum karsti TaxID=1095194 RepID=A0A9P6LF16_9PEZI|nr:uncharacterized protein CkaCkLH20_08814 [Colletotrichum karsti]KAF9873704.1 hypothetical protein CkaCkLH20_08814 [Colletotrichum karsti]
MSSRHRNRILPPSSLLLSYLASASYAAFTNDFSAYPASSRSCLNTAATASGCTGDTVSEMNHCLCGNGGNFVLSAAACVSKTDHDELDDVYEMLLTSCTDSKTPLGVSQAEFLGAGDSTTSSSSTTLATSTTTPSTASTTSYVPLTTYKSVANGVTVTVTRGIESVPTGTNVGKGSSNSDDSGSGEGSGRTALAAGLVGGVAIVLAILAFLCYRKKKQRQQRAANTGPGGKFAALSSATSLTTMSSPPQGAATTAGAAATTQYHNVNDQRPDTAGGSMPMAATPGWNPQHQPSQQQQRQEGNLSPQYWQQQNGQHSGSWPSPVSNGGTGTWGQHGVSPVSQYPPGSRGSPSMQNGTWNGQTSNGRDLTWNGQAAAQNGTWNSHNHNSPPDGTWNAQAVPHSQNSPPNGTWNAQPVPVPAPIPHPTGTATTPVFELPGDHILAVEADSTPIGPAQPAPAQQQHQHHQHQQYQTPLSARPSSSIQSTPQMQVAHPAQPAPAHYGMQRQVDDALQISRVELPPPRYEGPRSPEWVSEDKKFG